MMIRFVVEIQKNTDRKNWFEKLKLKNDESAN